ncbi:MAG: hypothetical protein JWR69_2339, partial [Pedosphaera sp.]|nr:hypothetical protein [Pedosphaera sp.]
MKLPMLAAMISSLLFRATAEDTVSVTGAKVTEAGIYTARVIKVFDAPGVVGGTNQGIDGFTLAQATTNIPARVGTRFGFRYAIHGTPTNAPIVLTMVGEHPPFKDPQTGKIQTKDVYQLESWIGQTYTSVSLDEERDLLPGKWKFEVWHIGKKLCEQSFTVFPVAKTNTANNDVTPNDKRPKSGAGK